jgi:hypothetical protein
VGIDTANSTQATARQNAVAFNFRSGIAAGREGQRHWHPPFFVLATRRLIMDQHSARELMKVPVNYSVGLSKFLLPLQFAFATVHCFYTHPKWSTGWHIRLIFIADDV